MEQQQQLLKELVPLEASGATRERETGAHLSLPPRTSCQHVFAIPEFLFMAHFNITSALI